MGDRECLATLVFYIQFLLFTKKLFQFVNVRLGSIKLVNTGNFYSQSNSMIHSLSSNFTEYHVTVIIKDEHFCQKHLGTLRGPIMSKIVQLG